MIRVSPKTETTNLLPLLLLNSNATFKQKTLRNFEFPNFEFNFPAIAKRFLFSLGFLFLFKNSFLKSRMSRGCEGLPVSKYNASKLFVDFLSAVFGARKLSLMVVYHVQ